MEDGIPADPASAAAVQDYTEPPITRASGPIRRSAAPWTARSGGSNAMCGPSRHSSPWWCAESVVRVTLAKNSHYSAIANKLRVSSNSFTDGATIASTALSFVDFLSQTC